MTADTGSPVSTLPPQTFCYPRRSGCRSREVDRATGVRTNQRWGRVFRGGDTLVFGPAGERTHPFRLRARTPCGLGGSRGFGGLAARSPQFGGVRTTARTADRSLWIPITADCPVTVLSPRRVLTVIAHASAGDRVDWCNTKTQRREERQTTFAEFHGPFPKRGFTERLLCLAAQWKDTETLIVLSTATHQVAQGPEGRRRGLEFAFGMSLQISMVVLSLVAVSYGVACLYTPRDLQIRVAKILAAVFCVVMFAVALGSAKAVFQHLHLQLTDGTGTRETTNTDKGESDADGLSIDADTRIRVSCQDHGEEQTDNTINDPDTPTEGQENNGQQISEADLNNQSNGLAKLKYKDNAGEIDSRHLEHSFWERLVEETLRPNDESDEQINTQDLKDKLSQLRNFWVVALSVANAMWLVLILVLKSYTTMEVLMMDPLTLTYLLVFGVVICAQFLSMVVHRGWTLAHMLARIPNPWEPSGPDVTPASLLKPPPVTRNLDTVEEEFDEEQGQSNGGYEDHPDDSERFEAI
ncbi:Hypp4565 [Branchiostoma lanceolatum]|uniref:Hypp4565 protein n=1 Tax=Branchiostoma lanceolatum TaxID=7740 RepID=A0A8K0EW70_BRALA|nr:Hypp4565 [Branchiostoma lanceolatum]